MQLQALPLQEEARSQEVEATPALPTPSLPSFQSLSRSGPQDKPDPAESTCDEQSAQMGTVRGTVPAAQVTAPGPQPQWSGGGNSH